MIGGGHIEGMVKEKSPGLRRNIHLFCFTWEICMCVHVYVCVVRTCVRVHRGV